MIINGNIKLQKSSIESLGDLEIVNGTLDLSYNSFLKDLGKLKEVNSSFLDLESCVKLESLGNLKKVKGDLYLIYYLDLISLGDLEYVYGNLNLYGCEKLKDLGKLKAITGRVNIIHSGITKEYIIENKKEYLFGKV